MTRLKLKETGRNGIEAQTMKYARSQGCYGRKWSSMTTTGVPDDALITLNGFHFFIEFKSPGKKPTHKQEYNIHEILIRKGCAVVVDNLKEPGVDTWKKDFSSNIEVWHDGFAFIDFVCLL